MLKMGSKPMLKPLTVAKQQLDRVVGMKPIEVNAE